MKTLKKAGLSLFTALAFMVTAAIDTVKAQPGMSVSFQLFYDELAPYGEWINDPEHGYIWLPDAEPGFQPYATNGHWVMTTYGNTWVSNYAWGWAPFHYGRWLYTDYYGWAWVPGYEWGPAWVSWRSGGGYYGWAPLAPRMSIHVHIGIPHHHWVFVPQRYICSPRIYSYYAPYRNRVTIYNRTTIINNTYVYNNRTYVSGPQRGEIERVTRSRVAVREINNAARPGRAAVSSRSVSIYRPEVDRSSRASARPSRVSDAATVRTASTRGNSRNEATASRSSVTGRSASPRASESRASTAPSGRNTEAARSSTRSRGDAVRPTQQAERTRTASPATRANATRSAASSRSEMSSRQHVSSSPSRQAVRPASNEASRPTTRTTQRSSAPSHSNERVSSQRQSSSPGRNSAVTSRSQSRPNVSANRSSEKSNSGSTRSRSSESSRPSGRGRG